MKTKTNWLAILLVVIGLLAVSLPVFAFPAGVQAPAEATPGDSEPEVATEAQLIAAQAEWEQSAHASTYDNGMGANTTCARCKSPLNWDPTQNLAQQEALNCNACKRVPGALRPELESGVLVDETEWHNITCEVCHMPVGESYYTDVSYWDQSKDEYVEVDSVMDLCAHCHEGRHGFEVIEEQEESDIHADMECTECHGAHGTPAACEDCHPPLEGDGAFEHLRHTSVNCTACHDAGGLSIWYDDEPLSVHYGEYIPRRFAHALTSWPSHNLQLEVECERCHHPQGRYLSVVASKISCEACHKDGAAIFWCENFPRDLEPNEVQSNLP